MSGVLGVGVSANNVHAVQVVQGAIVWAGSAEYSTAEDLVELLGRLAADAVPPPRRVRVVLERDVVQLRTIRMPRLSAGRARRYVALEAGRLFRKNGGPLTTDANVVTTGDGEHVVWAAATSEAMARAIVAGCDAAGLRLEALGPAAEVLPWALASIPGDGHIVFGNGSTTEYVTVGRGRVWQRRLARGGCSQEQEWAAPLRDLGDRAPDFAAAYGAAIKAPALALLPPDTRAARARTARKSLARVAVVGMLFWLTAGAVHVVRLAAVSRSAQQELALLAPAVDSALTLRQDLNRIRAARATMARAEAGRSRVLTLLADLTSALGDSAFLATFTLSADSTVRLVGYAPQATWVLADLDRVRALGEARLEGALTRERLGSGPDGRDWDRFAVVARLERVP